MSTTGRGMSRQRFILIGILFFHSVNTYMDRACIASAVDYIKKDLSISGEMMGLVLGIFAVGYALFQVPSGWIADHLGPRKARTTPYVKGMHRMPQSIGSRRSPSSGTDASAFRLLAPMAKSGGNGTSLCCRSSP